MHYLVSTTLLPNTHMEFISLVIFSSNKKKQDHHRFAMALKMLV